MLVSNTIHSKYPDCQGYPDYAGCVTDITETERNKMESEVESEMEVMVL